MPAQPEILRTTEGDFPLQEFHLPLAGREWTVLHTEVILDRADEERFFRERLERVPYGVALWPAAIALAYELSHRGEQLAGRTVLELGAGTGLPGIVAASLGARVAQTDRHELALHVCRLNGERNGVRGVEHRQVDWTEWTDPERYDFIIGSDILYAERIHPALRRIFESNLAQGGRVLLADPLRAPCIRFMEGLEADGWEVRMTRWDLGDEERTRVCGVFEVGRGT
ncbi:MAG: class I SAM-dependent methyltransferase [Armatimonadota bacterium]